MTRVKYKYVDTFCDRKTGKRMYYFRRPHGRRIRLPDDPLSREFREAYEAALAGSSPPQKASKIRFTQDSWNWLARQYFESVNFVKRPPSTKTASRLAIERYLREEDLGDRLFKDVRRPHLERMMTRRADRPGAANDLLKKFRVLLRFAISNGWLDKDPTIGIGKFDGGEHHTWTEQEIQAFEARWPIGSRERTAFALFIYTGQRLGDVRKMVWSDITGDMVTVLQGKTKARLSIAMHADLKAALTGAPREHVAILTTQLGRPFTEKGFGNWMASRIEMAGLPAHCVTHGLRKAASRRLAEAGCSTKEIMAITGHKTSQMVDHYTKAAEQAQMATSAIARLEARSGNKKFQGND